MAEEVIINNTINKFKVFFAKYKIKYILAFVFAVMFLTLR